MWFVEKIKNFWVSHSSTIKVAVIDIVNLICVTSVWQVSTLDKTIEVELIHAALLISAYVIKMLYYRRFSSSVHIKLALINISIWAASLGASLIFSDFWVQTILALTTLALLFKLAHDLIKKLTK